jgi:choline-sulfatase
MKKFNPCQSLALGLLPVAFASCENLEKADDPVFKNVVVIVSDDHAWHTLGCYGNEVIRTPNLDRLAREGVMFTNAYCNSPICSASRQSMLTGQYPQSTGVTLLFTPFQETGNPTIAHHLGEKGFNSKLIGKTHFNHWIWYPVWEEWPRYGFDSIMEGGVHRAWLETQERKPLPENILYYERANPVEDPAGFWNAGNRPHPVYDDESQGTFFARKAIEFMERNKDDRFFLWLAFNEPHAPFHYPVEYTGKYDPAEVPFPKGSPEDERWVPEIFRGLSEDERQGIIAAYYTCVEYMDKNIGLVINALNEMGIEENTLIIYVSDNGYLLNDHKRFEKHTMWSESVKVPLIISGNGLQKGIVSQAIIEGVDIVPTVIDLLGISPLEEAQGKSFKNLLTGDVADFKEYAYSVFLEDNMVMIANKEWKYVFMTGKRDLGLEYATGFGAPGLSHFLYNQVNDPMETTNLAYNPDYTVYREKLQQDLLKWFMETHPYRNELPSGLSTDGKLMWFAEPRDVGAEYGGRPLRIIPPQ